METQNPRKVAYLGMGIMGGAMAANLAAKGNQVKVWNRTPGKASMSWAVQAGATPVQSVAEAVADAQTVFLCLGDVADLEEITLGENGIAQVARPGTLVVDMSTTGPRCARDVAKRLAQRKMRFLDAPVSGGDVGAKRGTLTIMVGGNQDDFEECKPLLECMGTNIKYCGPHGTGQGVKLCNQILCAVNMVAVCEAIQLAESLKIDPELMIEVTSTGAAGSWALSNLGPRIARGDYEPGFMIKHMLKDLRLVEGVASVEHIRLPGTKLAEKQFEKAQSLAGTAGGEQGTQSMMRAYVEQALVGD